MNFSESRMKDFFQKNFLDVARRNKILARWAAGRMGYDREQSDAYVRNVILGYLMSPNDRRMIRKILSDFNDAKVTLSEDDIRAKLAAIELRLGSSKSFASNRG